MSQLTGGPPSDGEPRRTGEAGQTGQTGRAGRAGRAGHAGEPGGPEDAERWRGVERGLLRMRRTLLTAVSVPLAVVLGPLLWLTAGPWWAVLAAAPAAAALWGWRAIARNWASWRYSERDDDLLIERGVVWRGLTVVPYGRMQLVEVTSGPLERHFGLARVQLHTAAATTDAHIPGLAPEEAERLRERLTELGEARSAGL